MRILLAPMEGLLDYLLRDVLTQVGGIDECVTEFIRVTDTLLPARSFYRLAPELHNDCKTPAGVPVRVQLLGSDPVCLAENAAKLASLGARAIDLNFGCPAKTVNRHGGGAVLLKEPELLHAIVQAVRAAVPTAIPVTAKMRLGYDHPDNAVACAQALVQGGASELVIHARTKTDGYKPPAYWDWIARVREQVGVNVVANGEIWTPEDAKRCLQISGSTDLMLGRGMVANPMLAHAIRQPATKALDWTALQAPIAKFWTDVSRDIDARHRGGRLKQWLHYLAREYPQAEHCFQEIRRINAPDELWREFLKVSQSSPHHGPDATGLGLNR